MEPTEKELEDRLKELGTRLAFPPSDVDEVLRLLDQTEIYLSRVEQSPSKSMSDALRPAMNSLIAKEFLNHPVVDVKVFVAACINEIIRVTAPDAPYNDVLMKEIFAMIVDAFEKLDDMSGCLYYKRVSILEIMAKVQSGVVMLDLECDDLILLMFKHFLKSIRPDHPINIFSSMETIMTLILEESEDISQDLLICLLSNVQKSKKGIMPIVRRLAENVISNCSMKLKPYFLVAVPLMGTSLSDYSDIVASICQDSSVARGKNEADDNKFSEMTDKLHKESELDKPVSCPEEAGAFADKTRNVLRNGVMPLGNGNAVVEAISPEPKSDNSFTSEQCRKDVVPRGENSVLVSITEKPGNEPNFQYIEVKLSSVQMTDASDSFRIDGEKEASAPTSRRAGRKRKTKSLKSDGASDMVPETEVLLKCEREVELLPLGGLIGDKTCGQKMSELTTVEKEGPQVIVSEHKDHCVVSILDGKQSQDSTEKSLANNATAEVSVAGISDGKTSEKGEKETASVSADANTSENPLNSNSNWPKARDDTDKDLSVEPCLKEMLTSSKASMEENNDESRWIKFAGGNLIKKRRRKVSQEDNIYLEIIGREIEVWWPDDKMFYKGVIDAFDPVTEKHRVVYDDGDVEILFLRNERWNYVDSKNFERGQKIDIASPESSLQVPRRKQRRSSGKRKATRGRGKLGRKSKDIPIQQSGGENSTVKSRKRPRRIASELGTSLYEKTSESLVMEEIKVQEPSQINMSVKPPEDTFTIKDNDFSSRFISDKRFKQKNILSSGGSKSAIRSKGDSFRRKSKNLLEKDERTEFESCQTEHSLDDNPVDIDTSSGVKLDEKSKGRRKSALKSITMPRAETIKFSRILNEETLKTPSNDDKGIKIESSETNNSVDNLPDTSAFKYGSTTDTDDKLKGNDTLKLHNMASKGSKPGRRRRKETVTTTDANIFAITNLDSLPQRSVAKTSERPKETVQ